MTREQKPGAQAALLPDGKRLHLHHGPIDLIISADGQREAIGAAYQLAWAQFGSILQDLVDELPLLRRAIDDKSDWPKGPVAIRMMQAVLAHKGQFITPMASVAGAVADHMLSCMRSVAGLTRISVNNGGDIAIWLARGQSYTIGLDAGEAAGALAGTAVVSAEDGVGGIATSGWQGRSHSLGIADAVTVLAHTAAEADAAATLIANAVDLPGCPAIKRRPAIELAPDSDLGTLEVTISVGQLTSEDVDTALSRGREVAQSMSATGQIRAAFLYCQGHACSVAARPTILKSEPYSERMLNA